MKMASRPWCPRFEKTAKSGGSLRRDSAKVGQPPVKRARIVFGADDISECIKEGMGFQANVLKVMIASPGDVTAEREIITEELYRWNNANAVLRELILQHVKWETHSSPQM